jgi:hypothetical protein
MKVILMYVVPLNTRLKRYSVFMPNSLQLAQKNENILNLAKTNKKLHYLPLSKLYEFRKCPISIAGLGPKSHSAGKTQ